MGKGKRLRQAREHAQTSSSTTPGPHNSPAHGAGHIHVGQPGGGCLGTEVLHADGVEECADGARCVGDPHFTGMTCGIAVTIGKSLAHTCTDCTR